ncbi:hypothetical protein G9A89_018191 [Geosiphon pyriformis]|nr:hypothetical protein G9A89_018191 [Geosiphon pyriformis]
MVAEKTSYADLDALVEYKNMDNTTLRKTQTCTYVLSHLLKQPLFDCMSNNDSILKLPLYIKAGFNQVLLSGSCAPDMCSFNLTKSFTLNIELSAVPGKSVGDKLISIKKIFYRIDGFGGASTSSKFPEIIKSSFTSESSLNKAKKLTMCKKIMVNDDLRKEVIIKEIPVNLPKSAVESVFSKFRKIVSIKMQLISLWQKALVEYESFEITELVTANWSITIGKDSVQVAKAIGDKQSWVSRDQHRTLLYTLPVGTTAYDLSGLLDSYGEKICFIGHNSNSYVCDRCAVVCFADEASKLAAISFVPVFKSVNLQWAGLFLACCTKYKQFGHISDVCLVGGNSGIYGKQVVIDQNWVCLANIYKRKQASIIHPVSFGGKTWAQVAGGFSSLLGFSFPLGASPSPDTKLSIGVWSFSSSANPDGVFSLFNCLAFLEWSLELLTNQVSDIVRKLSFVELVLLPSVSHELPLAVFTSLALEVNSDMVLDGAPEPSAFSFSTVVNDTSGFNLSSSKILTTKVGGLELKMMSLKASINLVLNRLNYLCSGSGSLLPFSFLWKIWFRNLLYATFEQVDVVCWHISSGNMVSFITETKLRSFSGLWIKNKYDGVRIFTFGLDVGYLGAGVAVVINNFLTHHVSKVEVVLVSVLSLYIGAFAGVRFGQTSEINSIIVKTVNTSTFVVLGGDFNECGSGRSVSFKFCSSLNLVNSFNGYYLIKAPTWCNLKGAERTIDYIFVSESLFSTVVKYWVSFVSDFFDMDHNVVVISVGLGELLDVQLNGLCKQANKDHWKFKIKNADSTGWSCFRNCSSVRILIIKNRFFAAAVGHNLDVMWLLLEGALVDFVDKVFFRLWFSDFQCSKNKWSSKFLGLELLVAKIVKRLKFDDTFGFNYLVEKWSILDADKALVLRNMVHANQKMIDVFKYLSIVRKGYRKSKMYELKLAQETSIRAAIEKHMEKFCSDKGSMIKSVLNRPFWKVVLDHLVVDNKLVLDPDGIRLNYVLLDYVRDNAFFGVMDAISMSKLLVVVGGLPDGKATVLIIPKLYDWDGILTNTHPIVLIEIARKILSKILSDQIFFTCSKFGVLCGDNFSVLKDTSTQVLVFAVGSVVEDAFEKNKKLWLVLQNMCKVYDSVSWHYLKTSLWHIKMCNRFIKFFGSIYKDKINRVITNFGLSNSYKVHDDLDQSEVFSLLLWRIFYDSLLCKFVAKLGRVESSGGMSSFFVTGAFVDDTIWYALDIANEFFSINDISINSVKVASLNINGQPISIAKKAKHTDIWEFFCQQRACLGLFSYLVLAVLQPIVNYRTQFSFVFLNVYCKWDVLVRKDFKLKAGLFHDFSDAALHHLLFKLATVVMFSNALDILGYLFDHRFLDLQVLSWALLDPLQFSVKLHVSSVNNFLTGVVKIFLGNELFLANNLPCTFHNLGNFPMSLVLGSASYFGSVHFLKQFGVAFGDRLLDKKSHKRLDPRGPVPHWCKFTSGFLHDNGALSSGLARVNQLSGLDILASEKFSDLHSNGSLKNFGFSSVAGGAAAYFLAINYSISVKVYGLMSFILAKLQAVALALECVSFSSVVTVYLDSQAVIDACVSELSHLMPDFQVLCWVERHYIFNLIREKDLSMSWIKVKGYSGVYGNIKADAAAGAVTCSWFSLSIGVRKQLLIAESTVMSDNACHFVRDLFRFVCQACWEAESGCDSYLMKAVHHQLPVVVRKKLYNKSYLGVLCLLCREVELPNHVFSCVMNAGVQDEILAKATVFWVSLVSSYVLFSSAVLQFFSHCFLDVGLYLALCKRFVISDWCLKAVEIFEVRKMAVGVVVNFIRSIVKLDCSRVWLVRSSYRVSMEKTGSVKDDGVLSGLSCCKTSVLSNGIIQILGVLGSFSVSFGCHRPKLFFSGLDFSSHVIIDM